ncbi:MAG: hypothetical protein HYT22_01115 [Candidatus Niyogibacteria bacterium]|nr:hypothetical protein [Candidatus Niyogibacteria bacterium]
MHRLQLDFSDENFALLEELRRSGGFKDKATTIRAGMRLLRAVQEGAVAGFTEIVLRNPKRGRAGCSIERVVVYPDGR